MNKAIIRSRRRIQNAESIEELEHRAELARIGCAWCVDGESWPSGSRPVKCDKCGRYECDAVDAVQK